MLRIKTTSKHRGGFTLQNPRHHYWINCYKVVEKNERFSFCPVSIEDYADQEILHRIYSILKNLKLQYFDVNIIYEIISDLSFEDISFGNFNFFIAFFRNEEF